MAAAIAPEKVQDLDPQHPAPPCRVTRDPNNDGIGHDGRTLPLIGGMRPYAFDVILSEGDRLYADTYADVFDHFSPGYAADADALLSLIAAAADDEAIGKAQEVLFERRCEIATQARLDLQRQHNEESKTNGKWAQLGEEERGELERAESGAVPVGTTDPMFDDDDPYGIWEPAAPLVISMGDYAPYDPEGREAPESQYIYDTVENEDGEEEKLVWSFRQAPPNLVRLDPAREHELHDQLVEAKWLRSTYRPIDLPDDRFIQMIEEGARKLQEKSGEA